MQDYRKLDVWVAAHEVTLDLYRLTKRYPREELYTLVSQTRRAASSIAANLAEGCGMGSDAAFGRYVQNAVGSASELDYHLLLARDLGYLGDAEHRATAERLASVRRRLAALLGRLRPSL